MAKSQGQVTKIYELRTLGYSEISKQLDDINKKFEAIKKTKLSAQGNLLAAQDAAELKKYSEELAKLTVQEKQLGVERARLINEQKAAQVIRQQEINQRQQESKGAQAAAGSYRELYNQYKELYNLVKNTPKGSPVSFQGQTLGFDQAITKLRELAAAEQDFRRQFQRDGLLVGEYTSGIVQAFKKMGLGDLIGGQVTKANQKLSELNKEFGVLQTELSQIKVSGQGSLETIEKQLIDNRKEAIALSEQVGALRAEFRGTGDIGNQITSSLSKGFKDVKSQIGQLVVTYFGFQAAISGLQRGVETAKELSDQTTNLEIELNKASGGAETLVGALSKLDTRTQLTVLENIANIAARAGVGEQQLVGVTQAIDKIKIAFGKDFGDVETGTESLVKLINIFLGADQVTGENLLKMGNAIRTLANESVASVPFLNDFSQRMAGLKGISDISLPATLGLASGFEQFGQSAEVASTVLVKVIPKLATDTEKYGKIAGLTSAAFTELINNNPAEALLKVSEGLVKNGGDITAISNAFADSELGSGRIAAVLGVLGKNTDDFRKSITSAGEAFNNTSNIETAFVAKNENLAASLDKVTKRFADAANGKAFQATLLAISSVILLLLNYLPTLLVLGGLLAASWAIQNAELILLRGSILAYNILLARNYVIMGVLTVAINLNRIAMLLLNGAVTLVTRGFQLLGIAIRGTPIGILLTGISILGAALAGLNKTMAAEREEIIKRNAALRISREIQAEATRSIADQVAKLKGYAAVVKDTSISESTRLKALKDLIAINPEFSKALQGNKIDLEALNTVLNDYNNNLLRKAELEAASVRQQKEFSELVRLQTIKQGLEIAKAQQKGFGDLSEDEQNAFSKITTSVGRTAFTSDLLNLSIKDSDFKEAFKDLDGAIKAQQLVLDASTDVLKQKYDKANTVVTEGREGLAKAGETTAANPEVDIAKLKAQIEALDNQINAFKGSNVDLQKLIAERKKLQDELDRLLGKQDSQRRARLQNTDPFRLIDAQRDKLLADEEKKRLEDEINESQYLTRILAINQEAIDKKLKLLSGKNAEELKLRAQLQLERVKLETDTQKKLEEIAQRQFDAIVKDLQKQRDETVRNAQLTLSESENTPGLSETQRAQAKLDADKKILEAQETFGIQLDLLEEQVGLQSLQNTREAADAVRKAKIEASADELEITKASLKDIQLAGAKSVAEFKATIANARLENTNSNASPTKKEQANNNLDREENVGVLAREVASLKNQFPVYKQLLAQKQITDEQYFDFVEELTNKQNDLANALETTAESALDKVNDFKSLFKTAIQDLFNVKPDSATGKALGIAIAETYSFAQDAMNGYFDAEKERIQQSLELSQQRLDMEEEQVKAKAQSKAEEESIDKQYAAKRKKLEQDAFEKTKDTKKKEAKIAFLMELANIWSSVWSIGNPIVAAVLGAVLTGLAIARYSNTVSQISSQKFEHGGQPGDVPTKGGKFGGKSHSQGGTPFTFKGQQYEAEVDELSVIRTRNAPKNKVFTISGTQSQIASKLNEIGGGIAFRSGGYVSRFDFGGKLGESLQPPVFIPSSSTQFNTAVTNPGGITEEKFDQMMGRIETLANEQSNRIDRLEVVQVTNTVTDAQKKQARQSEVGTL